MAHDHGARPKSQGQVQSFLRLTPDVTNLILIIIFMKIYFFFVEGFAVNDGCLKMNF